MQPNYSFEKRKKELDKKKKKAEKDAEKAQRKAAATESTQVPLSPPSQPDTSANS